VSRKVTDSDVGASCTSSEGDVSPVVHDHRNGERHQRARCEEQVARIEILESKLDHGRTAAHGRGSTRVEAIDPVSEVVCDGDQS